jgi:predicted secreted protein with PEFG-CTERM motif
VNSKIFFFVIILFFFTTPSFAQESILSVNVSNDSFEEGDTIVISGKVSIIILETPVTIQIFNEGNLIEIAQIVVAQDGSFTHTILAEGQLWQNEGDYTVRAAYGEGNIAEASFEFFKQIAITDTSEFFEVDAGSSGTFDVEYIIRGGTVKDMIVDSEIFALIVIIESAGDGSLTLDLPRESIDATKSDGSDDLFIILIDGIEVIYDEAITNEDTRTITIQFEEGDSDIEVIGTYIIPEFGTIASLILAVSIISVIIFSAKKKMQIGFN